MVHSCFVVGCNTHSDKDTTARFFRIPKLISINNTFYKNNPNICKLSEKRYVAWLSALKRGSISKSQLRNARICNKHFISGTVFIILFFTI